jgi:hypothetical protein
VSAPSRATPPRNKWREKTRIGLCTHVRVICKRWVAQRCAGDIISRLSSFTLDGATVALESALLSTATYFSCSPLQFRNLLRFSRLASAPTHSLKPRRYLSLSEQRPRWRSPLSGSFSRRLIVYIASLEIRNFAEAATAKLWLNAQSPLLVPKRQGDLK